MWLNPQETADLVTFTEQILNGKLHFLYSVNLAIPGYWNGKLGRNRLKKKKKNQQKYRKYHKKFLSSSTNSNSSAIASQAFWAASFLFEVYGFYHVNKDIFELPLQALRLRLESNKCFFSWSYLYFVSTRFLKFFLFTFSSYLQKLQVCLSICDLLVDIRH